MHEIRRCRKCGETMEYRLGNYECPGCGLVEAEGTKQAEMDARKYSDPGGAYRKLQEGGTGLAQLEPERLKPLPGYKPKRRGIPHLTEKAIMLAASTAGSGWILFSIFNHSSAEDLFFGVIDQFSIPTDFDMGFGWLCLFLIAHLAVTAVASCGEATWLKWAAIAPPFLVAVAILLGLLITVITPSDLQPLVQNWWAALVLLLTGLQVAVLSQDIAYDPSSELAAE